MSETEQESPDTYSVFNDQGDRVLAGADRDEAIEKRNETPGGLLAREVEDGPESPVTTAAQGTIVAPGKVTAKASARKAEPEAEPEAEPKAKK
jgi:hypothetical protein